MVNTCVENTLVKRDKRLYNRMVKAMENTQPDDLLAVMVDVDKDTGKPFRGYVKTWSEEDFWDRNEVGYGFTSVDTNSFVGLRELIPYAQYWRECDDGMEWIGADKNGRKVRGMVTDEQLGI